MITLVLSTVLSLFLNFKFYESNVEKQIYQTIDVLKYGLMETGDKIEYLEKIGKDNKDIRLSYFDEKGNPIYDSFVNASTMDNHFERAEIQGALAEGKAKVTRHSDTLSNDTMYVALKLDDGYFIRIAKEMDTIAGAFFKVLPSNLLIIALIFILALFLARQSTNKILEPLKKSSLDPNSVDLSKIPEISPFIYEITSQKDTIASHLVEIKRERDTIRIILENMKEGLIILDSTRSVLVINKQAMKLFECKQEPLNRNILYVTRKEELLNAFEDCYNGKSSSGSIEFEDKIIKYYVNPVYIDGVITGSILLLIDDTKRLKAERIREEFSANVSHELKTPLTSICGFTELLKNNMVNGKKDKNEIVNRIYEESNRLLILIDEIIKISKLEAGVAFIKEEVDLTEMCKQAIENFEQKAKKKNITITLEGEATVKANNTMIWELISNLMDNAIKYNVEKGTVNILIGQEEDRAFISVKDSGIGIAEEDIERIFERFYRADKSRFKKLGGTGLGLSIVKHIVKSHGGDLQIESKINEGTKITVYLPIDE
ncbi:phosphate regulon sensor kinase PhoR [Peptoniphilus sp. ING2-D1G]|nr:phosphate regulon sensor kinase PhoR [Peptoniphilus sp. ING2-D1G]